jgi:hypothetical protein
MPMLHPCGINIHVESIARHPQVRSLSIRQWYDLLPMAILDHQQTHSSHDLVH